MSKEKSLRQRREEIERKRIARQSTPNHKRTEDSNKPTREKRQPTSSGKYNNGSKGLRENPDPKNNPRVATKNHPGRNLFNKIIFFAKENTWLFVAFTVFVTLITLVVFYNFSSLLFKGQDVFVVPLTLIPIYYLWFRLIKLNKLVNVRLKVSTTIICASIIVLFLVGMISSVTVQGKVYLSTSETAKVQKVTKSMWKDLEIIASAETLLLSTGAESRAFFPSMRDQSEELGKLSIKWAKVSQTESLPAPGLVEAASQIATSADWGSRALIRKAQSIAEPDPRADADVAEWTKLYQGNGSAAAETVVRVSELYGIKLGVANE